jgi:hypothetical protein
VDRRSPVLLLFAALAALACLTASTPALAQDSATISGSVYEDLNRDGMRQADEPALEGQQLYLFDSNGSYLGTTLADTNGHYGFVGLADGDYRVDCEASSLQSGWVPTTTGSVYPFAGVHVASSATVDFGWRPIITSSDLDAPIETFDGPNGLRVETFNDALSAKAVYDDLSTGTLVGPEAASVTLRFGYGNTNSTNTSAVQSNGVYTSYRATSYFSYASWLNAGDEALFHEYGHAWSLYYTFIVQQDPTLSAYLKARGLASDARVNSSYGWNARELIAEDYRQLFGSATAAAFAQANRELPPASEVPGLKEFLASTFTQPPPAATIPPPEPTLELSALKVAPQPVTTSATVTFSLSTEAFVTVKIVNPRGSVVRTLLAGSAESAGTVVATWNRRNAAERKVKPGTYVASVQAADGAGHSATTAAKFSVK